jgi:aryl-alcohol dehydrogenase-like predicted oxidoreductase
VTVSEAALNWEVSVHGQTVVAIPGASRPAQAEQAAAAGDLHLSAQEMSRIDQLVRTG